LNQPVLDVNQNSFRNIPLEEILNADGTLKLDGEIAGSINVSGYQMSTREDGTPVFIYQPTPSGGEPDSNWYAFGESCNDGDTEDKSIYTIAAIGSDLYVAGDFIKINGLPIKYIAKWDGSNWNSLGSGVNQPVHALATSGTDLYVGGGFSIAGGITVNSIAKWDGLNWSGLGTGTTGTVLDIEIKGNDIYVVGDFWKAGGIVVNNIAKWDGSNWSALGVGTDNGINAIAIIGNDVFIGGYFTYVGTMVVNYIAKWNGSNWSHLGGVNGIVNALAVHNGDLYVGGDFTIAGSTVVNHIAKWDGSSWISFGIGVNDDVFAVSFLGDDLYIGGFFGDVISKWDGQNWIVVGEGFAVGLIYALTTTGTSLYAAGCCLSFSGFHQDIAKWDGISWKAICDENDKGIDGGYPVIHKVSAIAVSGNDVYIAGDFKNAGGVPVNYVARWDGIKWNPLGEGTNKEVYAIAIKGSDVYFGGYFTMAGGISAKHIAKWDGANWSNLGIGTTGEVRDIAINGNDVYIGGSFSEAGLAVANNVARWNGSSWSSLGTGTNSSVNTIATNGNDVYVGGGFSKAGGIVVNNIAKWDGSMWSSLGIGTNEVVKAITIYGEDVLAGGYFSQAGGGVVNRISKWNGTHWTALGSGLGYGAVYAIAVNGDNIYAAGTFTSTAEEIPVSHIAKFDGETWIVLGSGLDSDVRALAISECKLYVGGDFELAGTKESYGIAAWRDTVLCVNPCTVSTIGTIVGDCDTSSNNYELSVVIDYATTAGSEYEISIGSHNYQGLVDGSGRDTLSFILTADGAQGIDISIHFVADPDCESELIDAFNAPVACMGTSVKDPSELGINWYPNPFSDILMVDFSTGDSGGWDIQIIDVNGKIVTPVLVTGKPSLVQFSLAHLPSGLYYVIFKNDTTSVGGKIMKM